MPGPCSKPNGTRRNTPQWIPQKLAARIAGWELSKQSKPTSKTELHKPGSQKK